MEKLKRKRGAKRSRFSLVANTLRRMIGEKNNDNITSMFLESLKKNLDDLQRLDRAIQELLAVEGEKVVIVDREKSEIYRCIYEQLRAEYRNRSKKHNSKLKRDKSESEKFQVLPELHSDITPESTLPNVFHQPAGDISECSPGSSKEPTQPSPGNVFSPANESWDQLMQQIEAMEESLSPKLVREHRHTISLHLRTISLTRLLVALSDDVSPERLPARDWRRVQRALAAPPLGTDRIYVIKNSFLLPWSLKALWATLQAVRRNDVERCSAARAAEGAAQRLERWRRAHRDYCAGQARGSLLLLQRRWHELRLLAREWARAGCGAAGEGARLLRELCRTFPHVVQEEPQRWQELRRAGELDLDPDPYDSGYSDYSDEEDGNLVIDEGPMEAKAGVGAGGAPPSDEGDDVIDKLHQIDPAQTKTTLIFDSDTEMDLKDVDPLGEERAGRAGELEGENCPDAPRLVPCARDRLVFEEDDVVGGGDGTSREVKSEPSEVKSEPSEVKSEPSEVTSEQSEVTSEGEVGERAGSGGAQVAAPARVAMDSKLMMEVRVPLVRVDDLPAWGQRLRGVTLCLGVPRGRRGPQAAVMKVSSSCREGSPRGKYAGKCEQLLSLCRPVSVLLERLSLDAAGGAGGGCGAGCRCAGAAGGARCGRVVLPQLAQVLARRSLSLTAQVAPLVRDHGTAPAPGGDSGEHADDRLSALCHSFDLDAEKTYEPEEMLGRTRGLAAREARWLRPRGAELLRRLHCELRAQLQRRRALVGEGAARGGQPAGQPLALGENVKDKIKKTDSKKKKTPPPTRGQGPADSPSCGKRDKPATEAKHPPKDKVQPVPKAKDPPKDKVKSVPEAKHPPEDGISEYERWLEERNRGSLMYGFKPREVRAPRPSEPSEPARKKALLNSHETVVTDADTTVEGGGGGKKCGFLRVVPLASLQGPSPRAGARGEARTEAVVDLCDEFGGEGQGTSASLGDSLIHHNRIVVQPLVAHFNVFLKPVAAHHEGSATQIPIGQILIPQNPVPQSSIPQNPVPRNSIPQNLVPQSSKPQNPVPPSRISQNRTVVNVLMPSRVVQAQAARPTTSPYLIPQNPVRQNSISQNPVPPSSIPQNTIRQNPVPQSSIPENPIPQSCISQNRTSVNVLMPSRVAQAQAARPTTSPYLIPQIPVRQSSIPQNPVPPSSIPQNTVPQNPVPQNPVPQSRISQNRTSVNVLMPSRVVQAQAARPTTSPYLIPQIPVRQSSIPQNHVPPSSIPQNTVPQNSGPQNSIPHNPVPPCSIPRKTVPQNSGPQNSIPQNPILPPSRISQNRNVVKVLMPRCVDRAPKNHPPTFQYLTKNSVPQSSVPQNPVRQRSIPQNTVPPSSIPQNPVPQSSTPQNTVPQSSIHQNPGPQNPVPQNPVPPSRISQNRNEVNVLIPRRECRTPAARPPTSQSHRDKAPQPQASAVNSSKVQAPIPPVRVYSVTYSSKDQSAINQTYIPQGHLAHIPVTQAPVARSRKVGPTQHPYHRPLAPRPPPETMLSTTTPLVTGNSAPFGLQPPVVGTAPPAAQPPWARSGKPTNAPPQPPWLLSGGTGVLPLTERNLLLHNRIFSKSRNK